MRISPQVSGSLPFTQRSTSIITRPLVFWDGKHLTLSGHMGMFQTFHIFASLGVLRMFLYLQTNALNSNPNLAHSLLLVMNLIQKGIISGTPLFILSSLAAMQFSMSSPSLTHQHFLLQFRPFLLRYKTYYLPPHH